MTRADMAKKCARSCQLDALDVDQSEVGLVDERRRLKAVAPDALEPSAGERAGEARRGRVVSAPPGRPGPLRSTRPAGA